KTHTVAPGRANRSVDQRGQPCPVRFQCAGALLHGACGFRFSGQHFPAAVVSAPVAVELEMSDQLRRSMGNETCKRCEHRRRQRSRFINNISNPVTTAPTAAAITTDLTGSSLTYKRVRLPKADASSRTLTAALRRTSALRCHQDVAS